MKKLKRTLSLFLTLVLCLSLAVPAFAADTLTGDQLSYGDWGNGSSLTLTGVVGMTKTPIDPTEIYDVEVGGRLVLEMTYPAGKNRTYRIWNQGIYILFPPNPSDFADWENADILDEKWDLPGATEEGYFDESSGKTQYVYNFTEADMGQKNGYDKMSYPYIYWYDDANGDGVADNGSEGSAYFGVRVVPAASETKNIAYASTQTVDVDGVPVEFQMYALKDENGNPTNYIKLRDLAQVLNGTKAQFQVGWNGTVNLETGKAYIPSGSEMSTPFSGNRPYEVTKSATYVDGKPVDLNAFILKDDTGGAYTYYQLRDLGRILGFNVGWSAARGIYVEPGKPYQG